MATDNNSRALTGAWIETTIFDLNLTEAEGRALTGAWIETTGLGFGGRDRLDVAPSRARGLKHEQCSRVSVAIQQSRPHGRVD